MSITPDQIFAWLTHYRYLIIFPLVVIEGPIITIISGFLSSLGTLNLFTTYIIVVSGDLTGDSLYYILGRYLGRRLPPKLMNFLRIGQRQILYLEQHFKEHPKKIFSMSKLSYGIGIVPLFAAGLAKFPFKRFLLYNLVLTVIKSFLLILVGFYFGRAYVHINTYLDYGAIAVSVVFIVSYIILFKYSRSQFDHENIDSNG